MLRDITIPDPAPVLDLLEAFRRSKTMFAGVELGIFDTLVERPHTVNELATRCHAHAESLERLLDALVGLQLLRREGDQYANTPVAYTYLTRQSSRRLTGYIRYSNSAMWKLWSHLEDAVREGTHRWKQAFDWDGPIFDHFFQTEDAKTEFLMGMHGFGRISSPQIVASLDLQGFGHFVDLGGATGHLAIEACRRYPHLRATVFDLAAAIPLAQQIVHQSGLASQIDLVAGDFFVDPLPDGDLFALGRIVHDWSPEKIDLLLQRIFAALPPGGGLLIAEKILWEDRTGPRWAQMQNLNMLTCTEGKERTLTEYAELLERAGFAQITCCRTAAPLDAILALKP